MTASSRLAIMAVAAAGLAAAAAGLAAGAATDGLLAAAGAARVTGLQVGVAAAPLLVLALLAQVRRELAANGGTMLVVLGAAWTLAPLIDQHATRAVVVDGALPDVIHHLAGWPALIAGARLGHPTLTS
jgi:hypothetical protein